MTSSRKAAPSRQPTEKRAALIEAANQLNDIAIASGKVVTHRVGMAIEALSNPNFAEHAEFTNMATEKVEAMVDVAHGMLENIWHMGQALTGMAIGQSAGLANAAVAIGSAPTPHAAFTAHQRWAVDSLVMASKHTMRMTALFSGVAASALEPVHRRVTANARRLDKR